MGGVPLRPLVGPWAPCITPRSLFGCILGAPGRHFGQLWPTLGSPVCLGRHIVRVQAPPQERKVDTVRLNSAFLPCKCQREQPQPPKCHENIVNTMVLEGGHYHEFLRKVCLGTTQSQLWRCILVPCATLWATLGSKVEQF